MTVSHRRRGLVFILAGPTGAGKNTIMNGVLERAEALRQLPTATTRPIRENELQGREHLFVNAAEFDRMIADNELLEWQWVHTNRYGVPRRTIEAAIDNEEDIIADIDVLGATYTRSLYPDNVVLIFVQPCELDDLHETVRKRLLDRGESEQEIATRLERVDMEMQFAPLCDYLIINDDEIEAAVETLHSIIRAERSRRNLVNLRTRFGLSRHRLVYRGVVLGICEAQVLCSEADFTLPHTATAIGELPAEAARRAIVGVVPTITATDDSFVGDPIHTQLVELERLDALEMWYVLPLANKLQPTEGWAWKPLSAANLPQSVRKRLEEHTERT